MPNVLLTTGCNRSCSYCFAREKMAGTGALHMSLEDVRKVIAFLKQSDSMRFRVMGGEPTLHPNFAEIVALALRDGLRVDVLSNATWREDCVELFARIPPGRIYFLLNVDHPDRYSLRQWARIERNIAALPERRNVTLSFNIFEREPRADYIFDLTRRFGIRMIRMSFSLPALGAANRWLDLAAYADLTPFILDFVRRARDERVSVRLDNAVPLCIFDPAQAGELLLEGVLDLRRNSRCEPVVDIGPDLTVWCCFCISKLYNRKLEDFADLQELEEYYRGVLGRFQTQLVPMEECRECRYRELWGCQGGCIVHALMRNEGEWVEAEALEPAPTELNPEAVLALAEDVVVRQYEIPTECYVLSQTTTGLELELERSLFGAVLSLLDGSHTAQEIGRCVNGSAPAGDPIEGFIRRVQGDGMNDLLLGLRRQGFVVEHPSGTNRARSRVSRTPVSVSRG
jgi:radical SAM protein with 4Fe4S-binding SPASM domain